MLWFSGNSVHAKTPNKLEIISAVAEMEVPTPIIIINVLNFGDDPQVKLGNELLTIESVSDPYIIAYLPDGISPGAYRLSVARSGFDFLHPEKADSLGVNISDVTNNLKSGDPVEPSGALEPGNIYEIYATTYEITEHNAARPINISLNLTFFTVRWALGQTLH